MSSKSLARKVQEARYKREFFAKKQKNSKDAIDNSTFVRDYTDFMKSVNSALNSESDIKVIRNNLFSATQRLDRLKQKLKRYIVIRSGSYFTRKVPKLCYSTQDRPPYYKSAKYANKGGQIPYDLNVRVIVRKYNFSINDKVSGKKIYKSKSVDFDSDTYNKFFKNLVNVSFAGVDVPLKELNRAFYDSKGYVFGSSNLNSISDAKSSFLENLFNNREYYSDMASSVISSTLKALMFGGLNRVQDKTNLIYFSSNRFYDLFTHRSVTDLFSQNDILTMLWNLSLAYGSKYYGKEKDQDTIEIIACIRANIVSIIRALNDNNSREDDVNFFLRTYGNNSDSDSMDYASNSDNTPIEGIKTYTGLNISRTVFYNSPLTDNRAFKRKRGTDTTSGTGNTSIGKPTSVTSTYHENLSGNRPKSIERSIKADSKTFVSNPNAYPSDTPFKNLVDAMTSGQSNMFPLSSISMAGPTSNNNAPVGNSSMFSSGNPFVSTTPYYSANPDTFNPFSQVTPGINPPSSNYASSLPQTPSGENNITTFIEKVTNLFGVIYMLLYYTLELHLSGKGSNVTALESTFNSLLKRSGLTAKDVPFATRNSLSTILAELEGTINNIVEGSSVKEASYKMDIKNAQTFNSMLNELKSLASKSEGEAKKSLFSAVKGLSDYASQRANLNNLELEVSVEDTEMSDDNSYEMNERRYNVDSLKNLKEIISLTSQLLPLHSNSVLSQNQMNLP